MTLEEHLAQLEDRIRVSKSQGDWIALHEHENLRDCLKKIKPSEYDAYIRCRQMYAMSSVKPVPLKVSKK